MEENKLVSIILPVYNGEDQISESIQSVINQTYKNWELLIMNDGSTDGTVKVVEKYMQTDKRIHLLKNDFEKGVPGGLNTGIKHAKGQYIARMDHDDKMRPNRLEAQVGFFEEHPEVAVCGGNIEMFGDVNGIKTNNPQEDGEIRAQFFFENPIAHPTVMFNMAKFSGNNRKDLAYDYNAKAVEDLELWTRLMAKGYKFANIADVVLDYRIHIKQKSVTDDKEKKKEAELKKIIVVLLKQAGVSYNERELNYQYNFWKGVYPKTEEEVAGLLMWIRKLKENSQRIHDNFGTSKEYFDKFLAGKWFGICKHLAKSLRGETFTLYKKLNFKEEFRYGKLTMLKFYLVNLLNIILLRGSYKTYENSAK